MELIRLNYGPPNDLMESVIKKARRCKVLLHCIELTPEVKNLRRPKTLNKQKDGTFLYKSNRRTVVLPKLDLNVLRLRIFGAEEFPGPGPSKSGNLNGDSTQNVEKLKKNSTSLKPVIQVSKPTSSKTVPPPKIKELKRKSINTKSTNEASKHKTNSKIQKCEKFKKNLTTSIPIVQTKKHIISSKNASLQRMKNLQKEKSNSPLKTAFPIHYLPDGKIFTEETITSEWARSRKILSKIKIPKKVNVAEESTSIKESPLNTPPQKQKASPQKASAFSAYNNSSKIISRKLDFSATTNTTKSINNNNIEKPSVKEQTTPQPQQSNFTRIIISRNPTTETSIKKPSVKKAPKQPKPLIVDSDEDVLSLMAEDDDDDFDLF